MRAKHKRAFFVLALLALFSITIIGGPALAQGPPDPRFGIAEGHVNATKASAANAGYTRITLRWDVTQPAGRDDWKPANVPDPFIEVELAAGDDCPNPFTCSTGFCWRCSCWGGRANRKSPLPPPLPERRQPR